MKSGINAGRRDGCDTWRMSNLVTADDLVKVRCFDSPGSLEPVAIFGPMTREGAEQLVASLAVQGSASGRTFNRIDVGKAT